MYVVLVGLFIELSLFCLEFGLLQIHCVDCSVLLRAAVCLDAWMFGLLAGLLACWFAA